MILPGISFPVALSKESSITSWLKRTNGFWFTLYASLASFCLYTCVYAFRKPFAAATFEGLIFWGINYKSWLVIFQVLGYGMSKFIGIRVISELKAHSRSVGILLMIAIAFAAWLLFALVPAPYNIVFLFLNGLPLGMVWGMIFSYLEGRRTTEVLGASLSVSFIFSAGLCRSVGAYLIRDWEISEAWMPFVAAAIFLTPLVLCLYLLDQLPSPTADDEKLRTRRQPMNGLERKQFIRNFLPGIILFVVAYMLLTAFRDFRDNFSAEVWKATGFGNSPAMFTVTEIPVSISVLLIMGSIMLVRNNKKALLINHIVIITGMILIGVSTLLYSMALIAVPLWMILMGLGLYLGYVPFNSIFFDRLLAAFQYSGTVGFIMYVADSFGYLGSILVLLLKELGLSGISWTSFFITAGYCVAIGGSILICCSMIYFNRKHSHQYTSAHR